MVRISKTLNGNNLMILCLLALLAAIHFTVRIFELSISKHQNCTYNEPIDIVYTWVNGSDPLFIEEMNKYLNVKIENVDSSKKRYEDKNELRFSLRSLEKYAPWINHVYLVTNGQIPYWLNLDCEKISVVTHDVIFKDLSNLPTFSSPAIESNLHRIPGLSKRFIYFNDDIFIGQPLYVDDFYAINSGYLIFLSYTIPSCATNCPWLYVGDGQCDFSCNIEKCQFDGGDCNEKQAGRNKIINAIEVIRSTEQATESNNEKFNQALENIKQKVQKYFEHETNQLKLALNASLLTQGIIQANISASKRTISKMRFKTDVNTQRKRSIGIRMPQNLNVSISRLVEEHNKKVLGQNKVISRRKRHLHKDGHVGKAIKRYPESSIRSIDGYLESLLYTQRLLNKRYGYKSRYVPAHAPIFLDREIMQALENAFLTEFELTERNRFRHNDDLQFSFGYYYFLMSETTERTVDEIFDQFDTDDSGTWSDREIRNILTKIYQLPLSYDAVDHFEGVLLNCSELRKYPQVNPPPFERYIDSRLPTISKEMVIECPFLRKYLTAKFGRISKYKYRVVKNAENSHATFRMLVSNITNVVIKLDEIRNRLTKFVCLNDNLDETKPEENELVRAILYDFYLSLFPHPSKFELPEHSRNRFLHTTELQDWKRRHFIIKVVLCLSILSLVLFTFFNVFKRGCCKVFSELFC